MLLKFIPLTALALGLSSGVALADHHGGSPRAAGGDHHASPQVVRDHREFHGGGAVVRGGHEFHGGGVVVREGRDFRGGGVVVREGREFRGGRVIARNEGYYRGVRRPIFVRRPIIRERYYDYYRRPALIVENYGAMPGYFWVAGSWTWNGYEWIWQPGHYEPDPNYGPAYDSGYYDNGY